MKVFSFVAYLFAVSAIFWLVEVGFNTLDEKCEIREPSFSERIRDTILGYFGYHPPEAPWWRPLCHLTSPDITKNLNTLHNYLVFCAIIVFCVQTAKKPKHLRDRDSRTSTVPRKVSNEVHNERQTFHPIAALVPFDTRARSCVIPKRAIAEIPDHFNNTNNNSVCRYNTSGRTTRSSEPTKPEGRFDKVLLGPVTASLKALSQVVVATFMSYRIPSTDIKWTTKKSRSGGPSKIIAKSTGMMAEITVSGGIDLTLYRVTGVQGLIKTVSCQTFRLTYRGLVLSDEPTTCMCGQGWHL